MQPFMLMLAGATCFEGAEKIRPMRWVGQVARKMHPPRVADEKCGSKDPAKRPEVPKCKRRRIAAVSRTDLYPLKIRPKNHDNLSCQP